MKDSAQLFGAPSPEAHKFAVDIFNFEKRIAEITPGREYLEDPVKVNNKMKVCSPRHLNGPLAHSCSFSSVCSCHFNSSNAVKGD